MRRRGSWPATMAIVVLPALVVAGAWWFLAAAPLRAVLAQTRQQHGEVAREMPSADALQRVHARTAALRAELEKATAALKPVPAAIGGAVPAAARAQWRLQVSTTLARHDLRLVAEERVDVDLPPAVARGLGLGTVTRVPAWSLRLEGGYLDVLAVIAAWQQAALPCHVFEIEMRRDPAGTLLWTMVVG